MLDVNKLYKDVELACNEQVSKGIEHAWESADSKTIVKWVDLLNVLKALKTEEPDAEETEDGVG